MRKFLSLLLILPVLLAACAETNSDDDDAPQNETAPSTSQPADDESPAFDSETRLQLESQFAAVQQAQQQIETIWLDLRAGKQVTCSTVVELTVIPEMITGEDEVSVDLRRAAQATREAISLWQNECLNPRAQPPANIIDQGVRAALAASDALNQAQQGLES